MEDKLLKRFLEWATSIGVSDSPDSLGDSSCLGYSLSVEHFPQAGGRGLAATRDLKKGELILRVPKDALLTSDGLIEKDDKLAAALSKYPSLSSTQKLCITLLYEANKGKSSWWFPYLSQLPRSYDLLITFNPSEIGALQKDDAIWTAEKAIQNCKDQWEEVKLLMGDLHLKPLLLTFKAWVWASATISSRTMHIPWDVAGCLCPVGDFFNYAAPGEESFSSRVASTCGNASCFNVFSSCEDHSTQGLHEDRLVDAGYDEVSSSYCFYARRNYLKGEQVLLGYGTYTNLELMEHYGFVLLGNPNDKAFLPLEPEMYSLCPWPKESLHLSQYGKPSFALLSTIRIWATPPEKRRSFRHVAYSGLPISAENEAAVTEWIANKCQILLDSCPTTLKEDTELLHTIDKLNHPNQSLEFGDVSPALLDEIGSFLEINYNAVRGDRGINLNPLPANRSINRWKLAIQWRLEFKKILSDCIFDCSKTN